MNHGQSNSLMATTRTYLFSGKSDRHNHMAICRDAVFLCCLTHGACVKVTGLQPFSQQRNGGYW